MENLKGKGVARPPKSPIKMSPFPRKKYATPRKPVFGFNSDEDAVSWARQAAMDPMRYANSNKEFKDSTTDQIVHLRHVMSLSTSDSPSKKRALARYVKKELGEYLSNSTTDLSGGSPRKKTVSLGPKHQTNVPNPVTREEYINNDDSERTRWVVNRVWPVSDDITAEIPWDIIGKGRADSCFCIAPGTAACKKNHIDEKKLKLQSEIGAVFYSWMFHEMGEAISNQWTLEEQETFSRIKLKRAAQPTKCSAVSSPSRASKVNKDIWEEVQKCFPEKSREKILKYFFNVFIPRKLKYRTENGLKQLNSDGDEM